MVLLHEAIEQKKLDTRVLEKHLSRGVVSTETVNKSIQHLPDDSENADWVSLDVMMNEGKKSNSQ